MSSANILSERVIHRALKAKVEKCGNRNFFTFGDQVFGYGDLDEASNQVAAGLQALGVGKGHKVGIVMRNRPEFLFLWFGLSKLGAIEVPINVAHRGSILTYMIDKAECTHLVVESAFLDRVAPVLKDLPNVAQVIVLADPDQPLPRLDKPVLDYNSVTRNNGRYDGGSLVVGPVYHHVHLRDHGSI